MPIYANIPFSQYADGLINVDLKPNAAIGGLDMRFTVWRHFGGSSGLIQKSMASGYYGVSGMNIVNSGEGQFQIQLNSIDTSGLPYGNYAAAVENWSSGFRTTVSEGFLTLYP